jgi:CHAT domain-containing protein
MSNAGMSVHAPRIATPGRLAATLLVALALGGCATPPPEAYVTAAATRESGDPVGRNARDETCLARPARAQTVDLPVLRARDLYCGGWTQPSARIVELRGGADLDALATSGVWQGGLAQRAQCGAPQVVTLAGGIPARLLACTRRSGGWPHVALVAAGPQGAVLADGLPAALPVIERLIAGDAASGVGPGGRSAALALAVSQLAAEGLGAGDVARYEEFMSLGAELNQAEDFAAAEEAYRAALALQERLLGRDNPNVAAPLMHLALNLSNQGRAAQAELLLARAAALVPGAADPTAPARLAHYRGLHALGRGQPQMALALLEQAEHGYAAVAPIDALLRRDAGAADAEGVTDPTVLSALLGFAEARRNRGVALARLGRAAEGATLVQGSRALLQRAGLVPGAVAGRSLRSEAGARGGTDDAATRLLGASAERFARALPGERPEAVTQFLAGARLLAEDRIDPALAAFRAGARILRARQLGLPPAQILPYLDALAATAARRPAEAAALRAEMFAAAQLAQRPQTTRLVGQATARLGASGGNPRVAEAVRRLQDQDRALRGLFAERDIAESAAERAALDARIAEGRAARAEAEAEAVAAAPGYRQLLQSVAEAPEAARSLTRGEALVTMLLGGTHGHVLAVLPDGQVLAARAVLGEAEAERLVARVRAGLAPQAGGRRGFDTAAAQALHAALLAPLAAALDGVETLLIAPDAPLLAIPMGLLLTAPVAGDDDASLRAAPWLVRRHAVVHVPSPQTLVTLRAGGGRSTAPLPYAGFGDPTLPRAPQLARSFPAERCRDDARLVAALAPLPQTRREVEIARELTGAARDATRLGERFTAAGLREAGLERYRVLHFATHALLPAELSCLDEPALMVSPPAGAPDAAAAFVPASAVMDLRLDADLVILSACNTGTRLGGEGSGGEALSGLARAFFFAGTRGLLVTHWSVDDSAAALTVADTLRRQAQEGASTAAALRGAQLLLLDAAGSQLPAGFAHPFYWSGFALIGDGKRPSAAPGG